MKNPNTTTEDYLIRVLEKRENQIKKLKELEKLDIKSYKKEEK